MKKITIDATSDSVNNTLKVEVIRRSDDKVVFKDLMEGDFGTSQTTTENLESNSNYRINIWGVTTGTIKLSISGDIKAPNPIDIDLNNDFDKAFLVRTN